MNEYFDLIKRLRDTSKMSAALAVLLPHSDGNAMVKLLDEAADAIEELSRENESLAKSVNEASEILRKRWIPVTERLPSYGDWVLGIGPKKGYYVCEYRGITHWSSEGYDPWFSAKGSSVTITHWMPLPEPPKEET